MFYIVFDLNAQGKKEKFTSSQFSIPGVDKYKITDSKPLSLTFLCQENKLKYPLSKQFPLNHFLYF